MTLNDYLKLQIGMFITDNQDTDNPSNYCKILEFKDCKARLQPMDEHGQPANAHPFWEPYSNINPTALLFGSEYFSLCHRFV